MRKCLMLVVAFGLATMSFAQPGNTGGNNTPPPIEQITNYTVEAGLKNPGVNNIMYFRVEALCEGCIPGEKYYLFLGLQADQLREVQPGDFLGKDGPLVADAQGKVLFLKTYDTFNNGNMPSASFYYSYKLYLVRDDGTPNGRPTDSKGWFEYWLC